jgi:hypothetical protein
MKLGLRGVKFVEALWTYQVLEPVIGLQVTPMSSFGLVTTIPSSARSVAIVSLLLVPSSSQHKAEPVLQELEGLEVEERFAAVLVIRMLIPKWTEGWGSLSTREDFKLANFFGGRGGKPRARR